MTPSRSRSWLRALRCSGLVAVSTVWAVSPLPEEFDRCQSWSHRLVAADASSAAGACLETVREDVADSVVTGKSWRGTAFQIGAKTYAHGIEFNANKRLRVRLGAPADWFRADVGLENNDDTRRGAAQGHGSVTFHVFVRGKEAFASDVRRLNDPPLSLEVKLDGAEEFEIEVKDAGDGRGWDQALWGAAVVVFREGGQIRLQDLPWADPESNPFGVSFRLGGQPSQQLLGQWERRVRSQPAAGRGSTSEVLYRDPVSGLEVCLEVIRFTNSPAVECVARFRNGGTSDTPILEDLRVLDGVLPLGASAAPVLHWAKGAVASFDDFAPQSSTLKSGTPVRLQPGGGRSSNQVLPFFNVAGSDGGVMAGVGWSGEWLAEFGADARGQVRLSLGQAGTRMILHPGESVRTPSVLVLPYQGDRWRGQNLLRRFLLAHHRPMRSGQPLVGPITCGNWGGTRAEVHLDNIRRVIQERMPLEYYWIDAEWYGRPGPAGSWAVNVGDWQFKTNLYPSGFKPLSDALKQDGRQLMLWFEPERVYRGTPWQVEHPDWLLGPEGDNALFNLGNPAALRFVTDYITDRITEFGLGCYRQDFNMDPLPFWQKADAPDRQGISEIRHIEGLYAFWDGLRARHPDLILDNCASGGRRIDLETVGRATPFWRTDGPRDPIAHQCHTYGLMAWVPLSATSQDRAGDDYEFRSSMSSALCLNWWVSGDAPAEVIPPEFPFNWARRTLEQYLKLRPLYEGDYYPLTEYSQGRDVWMVYQLDRPDLSRGVVVALRRPDSPYESARVALRGLEADAAYRVTDLDSGAVRTASGKELMAVGLEVRLARRPGSALLTYERQ